MPFAVFTNDDKVEYRSKLIDFSLPFVQTIPRRDEDINEHFSGFEIAYYSLEILTYYREILLLEVKPGPIPGIYDTMSTIERSGNLVHDYTVGIEKARKQIGRRVVLLFAKNPEIQYVVTLAAAGTMWSWCLWNKDSVDLYDPYEDKTYQPNQGRSAPTSTTRHQDDEEQSNDSDSSSSPSSPHQGPSKSHGSKVATSSGTRNPRGALYRDSSGFRIPSDGEDDSERQIPNDTGENVPILRLDSGGSPMSSAPPTDIDAHSDTSSEPEGDKNDSDYPWHDQPESASHSNVPSAQVDNPSDSPVNSPAAAGSYNMDDYVAMPTRSPSHFWQNNAPATEQYLKYMAEAGRIIKEVGPLHKIWKSGKWSPPYCGWCPKAKDYKHKEAIQEFWAAFCLCEPKFLAEILKCRDEVAAQAYHW
ncbi:hypothetical protein ONZ51_g7135 [Trametes cubensis]|uniref:Uncharacterized protein n=1 Tax=Trametes cubensis TaxID=1111947 RepID=A0AAD7X7R9_9APHY|nr:hypothetical protein ONZ51_g7135 [Trametes cubensis]